MRAKAKSSSTPYPIWIEGEYITEPPIRPKDGAVRPAGHYIDKGGYPGANVYCPYELGDIVEVAIIEGMAITGYPRRLGTAEMQITDIITEHSLKNGTVSFIYELDGKKRMRLIPWNELTKRSEKH